MHPASVSSRGVNLWAELLLITSQPLLSSSCFAAVAFQQQLLLSPAAPFFPRFFIFFRFAGLVAAFIHFMRTYIEFRDFLNLQVQAT